MCVNLHTKQNELNFLRCINVKQSHTHPFLYRLHGMTSAHRMTMNVRTPSDLIGEAERQSVHQARHVFHHVAGHFATYTPVKPLTIKPWSSRCKT